MASKAKIEGIFIYPTDTIYGIGCNAEDKKLVQKIRIIKKRDQKPFSIIAPSKKYILDNFYVTKEEIDKYLPGPYTLILKKKNPNFLSWVSDTDTIGIRIPDNEFTKRLQKTGKPIITTSVNLSGEKFANSIEEVNQKILDKVDYVFDEGVLSGKPSTIIFEDKIVKR